MCETLLGETTVVAGLTIKHHQSYDAAYCHGKPSFSVKEGLYMSKTQCITKYLLQECWTDGQTHIAIPKVMSLEKQVFIMKLYT